MHDLSQYRLCVRVQSNTVQCHDRNPIVALIHTKVMCATHCFHGLQVDYNIVQGSIAKLDRYSHRIDELQRSIESLKVCVNQLVEASFDKNRLALGRPLYLK